MVDEDKRCAARGKAALVVEIIQGKMAVSDVCRYCDLPPSEIEGSVQDVMKWMECARSASSWDVRGQYERQLRELQAVFVSLVVV
jgi:hypothetical protein